MYSVMHCASCSWHTATLARGKKISVNWSKLLWTLGALLLCIPRVNLLRLNHKHPFLLPVWRDAPLAAERTHQKLQCFHTSNEHSLSELKHHRAVWCFSNPTIPPQIQMLDGARWHLDHVLFWLRIYMFRKSGAAQTDTAHDINTDVEFYCKHPSWHSPPANLHFLSWQMQQKGNILSIYWINTQKISSTLMAGVHINDASFTTSVNLCINSN